MKKDLENLIQFLGGKKMPSSLGVLFDQLFEKLISEKAVKGDPGYTPIKGVDYFDGKDGKTPIKGVDYRDGSNGKTPIKGVDYFDGEKGDKGDPGKNGSPDTAEQIAEKINTLDEKIKIEAIIGLKNLITTLSEKIDKLPLTKKGYLKEKHGGGHITQVIPLKDQATVRLQVEATNVMATLATVSQPITVANPTGSFFDGQVIVYRMKSASSQPVTWESMFRGSDDLELSDATTGSNKTDYFLYRFNADDSKLDYLSKNFGF